MSKHVDEAQGTSVNEPNYFDLNTNDRNMSRQQLAWLIGSLLAHHWLREHAGADHRKPSDSINL